MSSMVVVYVDVDDTLVRSAGAKLIPITPVVQKVLKLHQAGAVLYCWSAAGSGYARTVATMLGLEQCFTAFMTKPTIMLDDQEPAEWRQCRYVHPYNVDSIEDP